MTKRNCAFLILFPFLINNISAQNMLRHGFAKYSCSTIKTKTISKLPATITETSGLIFFNGLCWTINDSGGEACLYAFEANTGIIKKTVRVSNAHNVDWEEITQNNDYIFVGDFGNNRGKRKDLKIYKIAKNQFNRNEENFEVLADSICFSYKQQQQFNYKALTTPWDCEAMIATESQIFLFSKNWETQTSTVYAISTQPGLYTIEPVEILNVDGLISGACLSDNARKLALIGYRDFEPYIIVIKDFTMPYFSKAKAKRYELVTISGAQTEGVAWLGNKLFFTCEKSRFHTNSLFSVEINQ
jgi:hypothetical protein